EEIATWSVAAAGAGAGDGAAAGGAEATGGGAGAAEFGGRAADGPRGGAGGGDAVGGDSARSRKITRASCLVWPLVSVTVTSRTFLPSRRGTEKLRASSEGGERSARA